MTTKSAIEMSFTVTVESLGGLGDGIASYQGKPLFISKSCVGDKLNVRIVDVKADSARGEIVSIITPGEHRSEAACSHYAECGGCSLMHFTSDYYQQFKRRSFQSALRQGGFAESSGDIVFLPAETRRRVEFKIAHTEKGVTLAYYKPRTHDLIPIERCHILEPQLQKLIAPFTQALSNLPYVKQITHVSITAADNGLDVLLGMDAWSKDLIPSLEELAKTFGFARVSVIIPNGNIHVAAKTVPIEMQLGKYQVTLPPDAFLQATREGQQFLIGQVVKAVKPGAKVADLFCGIGTYSFPLTDIATVHAVESEAPMVKTVEASIRKYELGNKLSVEQRDLFQHPLSFVELKHYDTVVINPPRIGAKKQCEELAKSDVRKIIMVSCNQATWARDAKALKNGGYSLESVIGIDQFIFSPHFEIVSIFKR